MLWLEDTSKRNNPRLIKLAHVEGTVYRVLATARHLFVLTSKAVYVWINLVEQLRFGQLPNPDGMMFVLAMRGGRHVFDQRSRTPFSDGSEQD